MRWILLLFAALVAALGASAAEPSHSHDARSEIALVLEHMRAGEYRHALAFVAHTAGGHRDDPAGAVLYGWLLYLGGQDAAARRILDEARERFPDEPLVGAVGEQLVSPAPQVTPLMRGASVRLAPDGAQGSPAGDVRVMGNGVLIDRGRRALLPIASIEGASRLWVRSGLGDFAQVYVERLLPAEGVVVARLETPLPFDADLEISPKTPSPGSVGFSVGHPVSADTGATWPLLSSGFIGRPVGATSVRELGKGLAAGGRGGAVFDAAGRLLGIAIPGEKASARLVPAAEIREATGGAGAPASMAKLGAAPVDRIYEGALRTALQVISAR